MFDLENDYDPDERLTDANDGLFFLDDDEDTVTPDLDGDEFDPDEEIKSMFLNDEYGDELEDFILDDDNYDDGSYL